MYYTVQINFILDIHKINVNILDESHFSDVHERKNAIYFSAKLMRHPLN